MKLGAIASFMAMGGAYGVHKRELCSTGPCPMNLSLRALSKVLIAIATHAGGKEIE